MADPEHRSKVLNEDSDTLQACAARLERLAQVLRDEGRLPSWLDRALKDEAFRCRAAGADLTMVAALLDKHIARVGDRTRPVLQRIRPLMPNRPGKRPWI
ncbi:hypothetical protein [Actinomadura rubrisoli]|uniref:Uncharacterized protein n=1 Tax=Actinomadura rubrisoli TaxID=2530368 RepID=A0A4R5CKZ7_9ACTN|nr:hypothetical protein [Actinomadura rubrisoli]TDD98132.1 hypothetical protein E1298_00240 [Actinomadura rubrisoli]